MLCKGGKKQKTKTKQDGQEPSELWRRMLSTSPSKFHCQNPRSVRERATKTQQGSAPQPPYSKDRKSETPLTWNSPEASWDKVVHMEKVLPNEWYTNDDFRLSSQKTRGTKLAMFSEEAAKSFKCHSLQKNILCLENMWHGCVLWRNYLPWISIKKEIWGLICSNQKVPEFMSQMTTQYSSGQKIKT